MSVPSERAYDLAWARGCSEDNECWRECADAAQASIEDGLTNADRALLANYDEKNKEHTT